MKIKVPTDSNIKSSGYSWVFKITIWSFFLSLALAMISNGVMPNLPIWIEILLLALLVFINTVFDLIGTAVASSSQIPFNSMNSRNVKGSRKALHLVKNAEKVSNFCNDVIGDICGIISGVVTAVIASRLIEQYSFHPLYTSIILAAIVSSLTIGGKAMGKALAIKNSNQIVYQVALFLCIFKKERTKS